MGNFTSKATGQWETEGQSTWNEVGHPQAADIVTQIANAHVITQVQSEACAGITIDNGGELDIDTYNQANSGALTIAGTLTMGVSGDAGLTTAGLDGTAVTAVFDMQTASIIANTGALNIGNFQSFTTPQTGDYTHDTANYRNVHYLNSWYNFTLPATKTMTLNGTGYICHSGTGTYTINGTVACGALGLYARVSAGSLIFGADANITGSNTIYLTVSTTGTYTNNKVGAFGFAGTLTCEADAVTTRYILTGDWSNANVQNGVIGATSNYQIAAGTLKCINFTITSPLNFAVNVDNSVTNPSMEWSGNVALNAGVGTYTTTWTNGTGDITLTGSSGTQTIDFDNQTIEDLIINCAGAIKQMTGWAWTDSLTLTAGTLDVDTQDLYIASGGTTITAGVFKMGASANLGFITAGFDASGASASTMDLQTTSIINNSGAYSCDNLAVFTNSNRGIYTQTAAANYVSRHFANVWYEFTQDVGATITLTHYSIITNGASNSTIINGIIATGVREATFGSRAAGLITIGAAGDFTGSASIIFYINYGSTLTNNRVTAFSDTGNISIGVSGVDSLVLPAWNFSNANALITGSGGGAVDRYISAGTLKCIDFSVFNDSNQNITVRNDVTNPSIEASGDVSLNAGAGTYVTVWTKGTGSITLPGGAANIDTNGQTLEDLIVDSTAAKTLTANAGTFDTITIDITNPASELDISTFNITSAGLTTVNGTLTGGISAGTGLTTVGLIFGASVTLALNNLTLINNSSDITFPNAGIINDDCTYIQSGNGVYDCINANNYWYSLTVNSGVTLTPTNNSYVQGRSINNINGTIAIGANTIDMQLLGIITFASTSDFTGNGDLYLDGNYINFVSFTDNKVSAYSFTGTVIADMGGAANVTAFTGRWDNADYVIDGAAAARSTTFTNGTLYTKSLTITNSNNFGMTITCSTNNPSFVISGNIDLNAGSGTYTTTWTKGSSTITLGTGDATTKSIDFNGQTIEDLVIDSTDDTDIKQLAGAVTTDTLTVTDGVLDLNGQTAVSNGAVNITTTLLDSAGSAALSGTTFASGAASTVDLDTDTALSFSGNIGINGSGTYTTGKGDWTLTGSSGTQTIDFGVKTLHDLVLNCTGAIKQLTNTGVVTLNDLTITAGILNLGGKILTVAGDTLVTGSFTDPSGSIFTGSTFTADSSSTVSLQLTTIMSISGTISIDTGCTYAAKSGDYTLTGGAANIGFGSKNINSLILNSAGLKTLTSNVTADTLTLTAGSITLNGKILTTGGNVTLDSAVTFTQSGTIELTGVAKTFDLDSTDQNVMSIDVAVGASITFQNGVITGKDLTVDGTAIFSKDDDDTVFENISGSGTFVCNTGTKYIYYTGAETFTGTLTNVILAQYGLVSGRTYVNMKSQLRVRL